jgi:hypothetical protein
MAVPDTVSIVRELGVRESSESGSVALLGAADHAAPYPASCAKAGHHETNRLAYFRHTYSTLLRSTGAELKIMHAGTAASFDNSRDARYVHAGGHNREA